MRPAICVGPPCVGDALPSRSSGVLRCMQQRSMVRRRVLQPAPHQLGQRPNQGPVMPTPLPDHPHPFVYKICTAAEWRQASGAGAFVGAAIDVRDGFIHLSTAAQVAETARLHFAGQADLMLLEVETAALGDALRYEASRGGALFPHLYGVLPVLAVRRTWMLVADATGAPLIPELSGQ